MFCFINFSRRLNVYGALTYIQALKWMSCTCLQKLWHPAVWVCECVCCCWASVLSADQWRLAAGRRAAIHFSSVQLCNPNKKKEKRKSRRQKRGRKEGSTCVDKSFRCCFSSSFNILQRKVLCVDVCVTSLALFKTPAFVFWFSVSLKLVLKTWRLKRNKTLNHT